MNSGLQYMERLILVHKNSIRSKSLTYDSQYMKNDFKISHVCVSTYALWGLKLVEQASISHHSMKHLLLSVTTCIAQNKRPIGLFSSSACYTHMTSNMASHKSNKMLYFMNTCIYTLQYTQTHWQALTYSFFWAAMHHSSWGATFFDFRGKSLVNLGLKWHKITHNDYIFITQLHRSRIYIDELVHVSNGTTSFLN